jgi:hypothetical protein
MLDWILKQHLMPLGRVLMPLLVMAHLQETWAQDQTDQWDHQKEIWDQDQTDQWGHQKETWDQADHLQVKADHHQVIWLDQEIWDQADHLQGIWDQDQMDQWVHQEIWDQADHLQEIWDQDQMDQWDHQEIWDQADHLQVQTWMVTVCHLLLQETWDQDQIHYLVTQALQGDHPQEICLHLIQWDHQEIWGQTDHLQEIWDHPLQEWKVWMKCIHIWMMLPLMGQWVLKAICHHHQKVMWGQWICHRHRQMILVMT